MLICNPVTIPGLGLGLHACLSMRSNLADASFALMQGLSKPSAYPVTLPGGQ